MFTKGDIIISYSRANAIADGVLMDATKMAAEAGFTVPVALTEAAWADCVSWDIEDDRRKPCGQSPDARLWDVVWMAYNAARRTDGDRAPFQLYRVAREREDFEPELVELVLHIGPGDQGEPVCTIMKPGED